jgi:Flp pilus assembly protein TadD
MTSLNNLEINGNLSEHPLAELLVEIRQIRLNGSLRFANGGQKSVIYFDAGDIVFAVSNSRQHRLYELLLREKKITKEQLLDISDFTDDLALRRNLLKNNVLEQTDMNALFSRQIVEILHSAFDWQEGKWIFSPHIRVKGDIRYQIDLPQLLIEYARKLSPATVVRRFKSLRELFSVKSAMPIQANLLPTEAFVFSRFENSFLNVEKMSVLSGVAEDETLKILYILWLGGFISRQDWNAAFNERKTSAILSANFTLKKDEKTPLTKTQEIKPVNMQTMETKIEAQKTAPIEEKLSLGDYLYRIENAPNHYETLSISPDATLEKIKQAYFTLAKQFHPDLFYKKTDAKLFGRIQRAFTEFAQAYETLKTETSREVYDYRMRKELAEMEIQTENGSSSKDLKQKQTDYAAENFEQGFNLLRDENSEAALPFLARAVHFADDNARYHAYHGKALSFDNKQRHKAEAELQTAVKLDAENTDFRLMLAEFFIQIGFPKRAEGELNRLLAIFPSNREAQTLLDSLPKV